MVLKKLKKLDGYGGLIAISPTGEIVMDYNSVGMFRGLMTPNKRNVGIFDKMESFD